MVRTYDIVIVGGGVMGASIACHLARRRPGRVILLEKSHLGAGASGKSGAIVRQHYSNVLTALLAQRSLRVFERFDEIYGGPPVFTRTGLAIVVARKDLPNLEANLRMLQGLGVPTRLLSAQELLELDPNVRLAEDEVAAWEADAGYVEAVQVVATFAEAARREGAEIAEGVEVRSLVVEAGRIAGVETNEGRYAAGCVVLATGPWAARLPKALGLEVPVQPCRTQVAWFRKPPELSRRGATYGDFVQRIYFKPTHGDIVHVGSIAGEEIHAPADPDSYDESADGEWLPLMRQRLSRRYPGMHRGYGRGGFAALYEITPDWHPIVDRVPGIEGLYLAVGFSGHGFKMSPQIGQLMAEFIVDGRPTSLDLTPLRLSRFAENDPVRTAYSYGVMG